MDDRFEDEFELVFEELFEDELELVFEELFEEELELEFEELFEDELELELDELLPATIISPSVRPVACEVCWEESSTSGRISGYSRASAAGPTNAAKPATSAVLRFQCFVMPFTPS